MAIAVTCGHCDRTLQANERLAGRTVKCPQCQHRLQIPAAQSHGDDDFENEFEALKCRGCQANVPFGVVICEECGANVRTGKIPARRSKEYTEFLDIGRPRWRDLFKKKDDEESSGMDLGLVGMAYGPAGLLVMAGMCLLLLPVLIFASPMLLIAFVRLRIVRNDASAFTLYKTHGLLPWGRSLVFETKKLDRINVVMPINRRGMATDCRLEFCGKGEVIKDLKIGLPLLTAQIDADLMHSRCQFIANWLNYWTSIPTKVIKKKDKRWPVFLRYLLWFLLGYLILIAVLLLVFVDWSAV